MIEEKKKIQAAGNLLRSMIRREKSGGAAITLDELAIVSALIDGIGKGDRPATQHQHRSGVPIVTK